MRHLIILPGNSLKNKAWGELMLEHYGASFDSSYLHTYAHWESGAANIDFEQEEAVLREHVTSLPPGTEVTVFAKSAGSLLAFTAMYKHVIAPAKCVFFGIPFDLAADNLFKDAWEAVDTFRIPAIAFHNLEDPTTSHEFTKQTLSEHAPHIKLITTGESDHWYGDVPTYSVAITPFLMNEVEMNR